jgi:peptide/nickel transport system substrate-binding protein
MILRTGSGRRHRRTAVAGLAVLALALTACSGSSSAGSTKKLSDKATTLVAYTGQAGDYQANFNPFSPSRIGGLGTIFEPLFFVNKAKTTQPQPLLGTESKWNAAGTELTVTTRGGVKWTDGQPFTAKDVVFTFEMLKKNPAINNWGFDGDVKATDDTHVVFTWKAPAYVIAPDAISQVPIIPEHLWKDVNPITDVVAKPVGTGAYKLGEFKPQAFTLVANPNYWGGAPAVKTVRWLSLSGNQAGADAIAAGSVDWQTGPIPDIQNTHQHFPMYDKLTAWQNQTVLATCSSEAMGCKGPQTDPAVRRALYYAMDRTQVNNLAFEKTSNTISPSFALTPTQDQWVSSSVNPKTAPDKADPAKADSLLQAAGWVKGADGIYAKGGKKLSLTVEVVTGWTDYITALQTITSQAKAAGIKIETAQSSWNEWTDKKTKGNFELAIDSLYQGPMSDPYYVYNYFFTTPTTAKVGKTAATNISRFSDPTVDDAVAKLKSLNFTDTAPRLAQFDIIQKEIVNAMPYIPVLTGGTTSIWNTQKFSGWPTDSNLYAFPAVWSALDCAQILKALKPTGK